jgi:hypothetical protein
MPSGCIGASSPRQPVQKPAVIKSTQAWAPPVLGMPRELNPICNIPSRSPVPLALKLFSSSAASSNTQKSGPAGSPPSSSFPSPHLFPPSHISHISRLFFPHPETDAQAALHATAPHIFLRFARVCTVSLCACVCVCFCACVRTAPTATSTTACQVGCFLFCASAPALLSTRLHGAERELDVQRARCQVPGTRETAPRPPLRKHANPASSPPSKQQQQQQQQHYHQIQHPQQAVQPPFAACRDATYSTPDTYLPDHLAEPRPSITVAYLSDRLTAYDTPQITP